MPLKIRYGWLQKKCRKEARRDPPTSLGMTRLGACAALLFARIGLADDQTDRVLIKTFETAFALQVFEVAADSAVFRELVELTPR